jgi:hypothetical protein
MGGSEGKVGLAPVLQAAGGLTASAGAVVLAALATGHLVTFLEAQTHEGSLCWACAGPDHRPDQSPLYDLLAEKMPFDMVDSLVALLVGDLRLWPFCSPPCSTAAASSPLPTTSLRPTC